MKTVTIQMFILGIIDSLCKINRIYYPDIPYLRDCNTAFIKHVFPKLRSPEVFGLILTPPSCNGKVNTNLLEHIELCQRFCDKIQDLQIKFN